MKTFTIENDFWDVFPHAKIGVVICANIDNTIENEDLYGPMIAHATEEASLYLTEAEFSQNSVVRVWRDAFQKFKTKKGARSSIEALLKRVDGGKQIGPINPLVDIYNCISLKYALPCGGEDIDSFAGNVRLTKAEGDEHFVTLGTDKNEPPHEGEIIYKDDMGAICRCWNWRESVRTMLTEQTNHAFLCVELVDEQRADVLTPALEELAKTVQSNLGGTYQISVLEVGKSTVTIAD